MTKQLNQFSDRLKRIEDPRNIAYKDPETGMAIPRRLSIGQIKEHNFGEKVSVFAVILSVIIGALSMIGARYVRFVGGGIPEVGTEPQTLLLMDFGIAAVLAMVVGGMIGHKQLRHMNAQFLGIAVMLVAMHNLVWAFPDQVAQVFPQSYIAQVQSVTAPMSLSLLGNTYTF